MEVRCGHCNKLFRVSDDKVTGAGIKFKCTACGEYVKITMEDFQSYKLSSEAVSVLDTFAPKPSKAVAAAPEAPAPPPQEPAAAEGFAGFDVIEEKEEAGEVPAEKAGPAPSPPPSPKPGPQPAAAMKTTAAPLQAAPEKPAAAPAAPAPSASPVKPAPVAAPAPAFVRQDIVHPLVSGSAVGAAGGIGCAVPSVAMTILGVGMLSALFGPKGGDLPVFQAAFTAGASMVGAGIVIGVVLAMIQAKSDRSMFGVLGVFLGAFLGAVFGAFQGLIVAAGSGAILGAAFVVGAAIGWGFRALLVSIAVVIVRRTILSSKREAFGTSLTGGQMMGVALAGVLVIIGVFGEVSSASKMKTAKDEATKVITDTFSPEGLQVTSSLATWDPANGDLILNVTIENAAVKEKAVWYLVADVYDATGAVLIQAKMLNGKQLYTQRDYDVMTKRGVNVQDFRMKQLQEKETAIPPKGVVNVELRVMEPPAGVASFVAAFQPFDPAQMIRESMEEAMKQQQQQPQQR